MDPQFCTIADSEFLEIASLGAENQYHKPFAVNSFSFRESQETGTVV